MIERSTLVLHQGHLCVRQVYGLDADPVWRVLYWPIRRMSEAEAAQWDWPLGAELVRLGTSTYYEREQRLTFELWEGGQTRTIDEEEIPAVAPKSRGKDLRWHWGQWEVLLKTGWKFIPSPIP